MSVTIVQHTITNGQWKKISTIGQSGAAWVNQVGFDGSSRIIISHTDTVQAPTDNIPWASAVHLDENIGFLLEQRGGISPVLEANNGNDVFYATLLDDGETAQIQVDFN